MQVFTHGNYGVVTDSVYPTIVKFEQSISTNQSCNESQTVLAAKFESDKRLM